MRITLEDVREWIADGEIGGVYFDKASVLDAIDNALTPTIRIVIDAGVVVDVVNLPEHYNYEIEEFGE